MRDCDYSAASPSLSSASPRPTTMEVVVQTPFIAVEGLGADVAAAASDGARQCPVRPQRHSDGPESPCLAYTDACLAARLADVIAEELLQGHALLRHGVVGGPRTYNASAKRTTAAAAENSEVLTFTMGPQGTANSSFLFGGTLGWPLRQRALPATVPLSSQPFSGLFAGVLDRLFRPTNTPADTQVVAAMSVTEVRDAAPLRHPSVLQRPRSTVDLLSGAVLRTELDEVEGLGDSVDHPSDIPAACYVRVESTHDAMAVLYAALSCSVGWRYTDPLAGEMGNPEANASPPSRTSFAFLQPACEPLEERMCHVCVTLIVSCEPLRSLQRQEVPQSQAWTTPPAADNFNGEAGHRRGSFGPVALPSAASAVLAPVGIWKLWDVAGPSVSCGYRPLTASSPKSEVDKSTVNHSTTVPVAGRPAPSAQLPTPLLPWSSRYSLAALTHTCLAEVGSTLSSSALSLSTGTVDALIPALRHDTSAALQIVSSAVSSCSLVVPICSVVAEAAVDDVNSEVLVAAAGWAALGRKHQREKQRQCHQGRHRVRGLDNADAARRVLQGYTVLLRDFVAERYGAADDGGPASSSFAKVQSPLASLIASQVSMKNDQKGGSARQEAARASGVPLRQASPPTSPTIDSSPAPEASEHDVALRAGAAPARRVATNTVAVGGNTAATVPLSINVTADAEVLTSFSLRSGMEAGVRSTTPVDVPQNVLNPGHGDALAVGAVGNTGGAALSTACSATSPASVAATCASAAAYAEEAKLRRFHALFESESFDMGDEADVTAPMEAARQHGEASSCGTGGVVVPHGHHREQTPLPQHTPRAKKSDSPPSVFQTSRRPDLEAHTRAPSSLKGLRASLLSAPLRISVESALHESMADVDTTASSLCPPQELLYDVTIAPQGERPSGAEMGAAATCDVALDACAKPTNRPAPPLPSPDAALAAFLGPYCDEFVRLCDQMCADVRAWRVHEAATLDQLSALAARHADDIGEVAALQRRLAAPSSVVHAGPGPKGASTWLSARGGGADVGAFLCDALTDGHPDLAVSRSAAVASTSTLIFEQLVKSEEKVAWLERQLVDWRRRANEAFVRNTSNANADAEPLTGNEGDRESTLGLSSLPPAVATKDSATVGGVLSGLGDDPTAPHVRKAKAILQRLLQRCTRAYAAAQEQGDRWHRQLVQEQATKAVLQDRVMELEAELAGLRHQRSGTAASPHFHRSSAPSSNPVSSGVYTNAASFPPTDSPPGRFTASPPPVAVSDTRSPNCTLNAAPVSPIASDTASSFPSSSVSRGLQRRCDSVAGSATLWDCLSAERLAARGAKSAGDCTGAGYGGVVSPQLAVLLSRAVLGRDTIDPSATVDRHIGTAAAPSHSAVAPAPLFDIHVGALSTISSGGADSPSRRAAPGPSSSMPLSFAGGAAKATARVRSPASNVESREIRQRQPPPSRWQDACRVKLAATPPSRTRGSVNRILEGTRDAGALHHHVSAGTEKIGGGALLCAASHPPLLQCHVVSDDELEVYPSAALGALEQAATQLEAEAVRLYSAAHNTSDTAPGSQFHVTATECRQLGGGDEVTVRKGDDTRAVHPYSLSPLYQSMEQLRSATQAVQREVRDAAERERAYLSTILFSTDAGAE
ncbi:hypothetical protein MNV84_02382 [Leishmania braziliensis]|nr:hypothetical protein MNV84_02382 [Leishmania braziliensis]